MPLTREELQALAQTDVLEPIPSGPLAQALSTPPFIPTRAIVNLRDIGASPGSHIRPGLAYRSGGLDLAKDDPASLAWLAAHVRRVFDVRGPRERAVWPDPAIDGVEETWLGSTEVDGPPDLSAFAGGGGEDGVRKEYFKVLAIYQPTIRAVLEHVRDQPGQPFLVHCTAGRDRTGVVAGLLQGIAGASPEDVRFDYMLSRIGTELGREKLLQFAMMGCGITDVQTPGFYNLCSLRDSCWDAFVAGVDSEYGGWHGYVTKELGFSADDLAKIKANLTAKTT